MYIGIGFQNQNYFTLIQTYILHKQYLSNLLDVDILNWLQYVKEILDIFDLDFFMAEDDRKKYGTQNHDSVWKGGYASKFNITRYFICSCWYAG